MHESEKWKWSRSVVSDSSRPHGLQPTRLLCPWDFQARVLEWVAIAFSVKQLTSNYTGKGGRRHRKNESFTVYEVFHRRTLCVSGRLVAQSCLTPCDPIDCSLPGSSVHGDSPGKNTEVGCHALPQGIFSTQGSNPGLTHCRKILYSMSHQGSP